MKYPLDPTTFTETLSHLAENNKAQNTVIQKMGTLLEEALDNAETADSEWYVEVEQLLKDLHSLKMYHESRRFNQENFNAQTGEPAVKLSPKFLPESPQPEEVGEITEEELSRLFKEKRQTKKSGPRQKTLKEMTMEEIEAWEAAQDNSNDIYKIKARIANLARGHGMVLTPVGEILCNSFTHMCKALYDFAEQVQDPNTKIQLVSLIRNQEGIPSTIIAAAGAGVKKDKKDQDVV